MKKIFVVAKCAQTIDGKIATACMQSKWITSAQSRQYARKKRGSFDAIMVGIKTVLADDPSLDASTKKKIKKIVLDSRLQISPKAKLFKRTAADRIFIVTTKLAPKKRIKVFEDMGVNVVIAPVKANRVNLKWFIKKLPSYAINKLLIEGGAHVIGRALKSNLVNQMHIYIAPKIIGDQKALSSIVGLNILNIQKTLNLKTVSMKKIGKDILVIADVHRNR